MKVIDLSQHVIAYCLKDHIGLFEMNRLFKQYVKQSHNEDLSQKDTQMHKTYLISKLLFMVEFIVALLVPLIVVQSTISWGIVMMIVLICIELYRLNLIKSFMKNLINSELNFISSRLNRAYYKNQNDTIIYQYQLLNFHKSQYDQFVYNQIDTHVQIDAIPDKEIRKRALQLSRENQLDYDELIDYIKYCILLIDSHKSIDTMSHQGQHLINYLK